MSGGIEETLDLKKHSVTDHGRSWLWNAMTVAKRNKSVICCHIEVGEYFRAVIASWTQNL